MGGREKTLVVKYDDNEFEKYYNSILEKHGMHVLPISYFEKNSKNSGLLEKIRRVLCLLSISRRKIQEYNMIIVFEDIALATALRMKATKRTRIIYWQWNLLSETEARKLSLIRPFCELWTFDSFDAKRYSLNLNCQFYDINSLVIQPYKNKSKRAFCACVDKGRYKTLKNIQTLLQSNNIECDFLLVRDVGQTYADEDYEWISNQGIPYSEFLYRTLQSDIIVDLVQPNQTGITVRVLEALFYNKKLITNNIFIKQYDFYNSDNIFIYEQDDENSLYAFLNTPYKEISDHVKANYTVEAWLSGFANGENV